MSLLLLFALALMADQPKVGELERLGKTGQDFLVIGLDAPGFDQLSPKQKILSYYLYRAAIAGNDLFTDQNHRYGLEIKDLMEQIYLNSEGLDPPVREAVHDYLKYLWLNHGHYHHNKHQKYLPNRLTPEMLRRAAEHARQRGARLKGDRRKALGLNYPLEKPLPANETLDQKLKRLEPHIFDPQFEPLQVNQKKGDDILATSFVNLYHPGITQALFDRLEPAWKARLNVRFHLRDGQPEPQLYRMGGIYDRYLETISHFLKQALPYAESNEQRAGLQALLDYYRTGDEKKFREYSVHWLKSDTVIDYLNGFVEQYKDPRGVIGQFEGNVSFVSDSTLIERLADSASYFEKKMPWPEQYRKEKVSPPVANVVNVVVETGDSGPNSPVAYNLPNYEDIRRDVGSKNIILLNVEEAQSEKIREQMIREFYLPEFQEDYRAFDKVARKWEVYMHEVIGHGSGRPDPKLTQDPRTLIGLAFSSLEECRADLVALYHVWDPKLVEIGAFTREEQPRVARAMYIGYLQGTMNRYRSLEDDIVREAHRRGRQLILSYLVENNYGARVVQRNGNYYAEISDLERMHQGVAELLGKLQVVKSTGDAEGATQIFDRYGTRVNTTWRDNIKERAARLRIPDETVFVFPQLVPVLKGNEIVDVRIETKEDLTAQQLRWSRWRFNTRIPAE
ncbi:MAG: hypothetical protein HY652_10145 [Acidobacteria bacterium]|nr:hypothetical protein [Acidobacteriota bacterium]